MIHRMTHLSSERAKRPGISELQLPQRRRLQTRSSSEISFLEQRRRPCPGSCRNESAPGSFIHIRSTVRSGQNLRKLIAFDDDTLGKLTQLGRDRMATFQELADEAFADLLKKHGIPVDLKDALRKSAGFSKATTPKNTR